MLQKSYFVSVRKEKNHTFRPILISILILLFIFHKCFILVRVATDPEPIPGILGVSREQTLEGMYRSMLKLFFLFIHNCYFHHSSKQLWKRVIFLFLVQPNYQNLTWIYYYYYRILGTTTLLGRMCQCGMFLMTFSFKTGQALQSCAITLKPSSSTKMVEASTIYLR